MVLVTKALAASAVNKALAAVKAILLAPDQMMILMDLAVKVAKVVKEDKDMEVETRIHPIRLTNYELSRHVPRSKEIPEYKIFH